MRLWTCFWSEKTSYLAMLFCACSASAHWRQLSKLRFGPPIGRASRAPAVCCILKEWRNIIFPKCIYADNTLLVQAWQIKSRFPKRFAGICVLRHSLQEMGKFQCKHSRIENSTQAAMSYPIFIQLHTTNDQLLRRRYENKWNLVGWICLKLSVIVVKKRSPIGLAALNGFLKFYQ